MKLERDKESALRAAHELVDAALKEAEGLQPEWCEGLFYQVLFAKLEAEMAAAVRRHDATVEANVALQTLSTEETPH